MENDIGNIILGYSDELTFKPYGLLNCPITGLVCIHGKTLQEIADIAIYFHVKSGLNLDSIKVEYLMRVSSLPNQPLAIDGKQNERTIKPLKLEIQRCFDRLGWTLAQQKPHGTFESLDQYGYVLQGGFSTLESAEDHTMDYYLLRMQEIREV